MGDEMTGDQRTQALDAIISHGVDLETAKVIIIDMMAILDGKPFPVQNA